MRKGVCMPFWFSSLFEDGADVAIDLDAMLLCLRGNCTNGCFAK